MTGLRSAMIWAGGIALLAATLIDTVSVIGRQVGFAVHGAIEMIQAAVLVAGSVALVAASVAGNHARVRLVVERLGNWRKGFEQASDLLTAVFLGALLTGSAWLAADLWHSHEVSELAGIPWRWLRMVANIAFFAMIVIALRDVFRARQP
jgi:hypothetical protein